MAFFCQYSLEFIKDLALWMRLLAAGGGSTNSVEPKAAVTYTITLFWARIYFVCWSLTKCNMFISWPTVGVILTVSGIKNCLRSTLLHVEALVIASRNTSIFPTWINRFWTPGTLFSRQWRLPDSAIPVRASYRRSLTCDLHRPRETLFFQRRSSRFYRNMRHLELGQHSLGFPLYWSNVCTTIWRRTDQKHEIAYVLEPVKHVCYRYTSMCSTVMHISFWPFIISSGRHFNNIALFKMKCRSNAFAECAITMICLTQGRVSQRYANVSPTGSSKNECFLL